LRITGPVPGYSIKYATHVTADPSGRTITVPGRSYLLITLRPAQAHTDSGSAKTARLTQAAGLLARVALYGVDQPDIQAGLAAWDAGLNEQALSHLLDAVRGAEDVELRDRLRAAIVGMFAELGEHHPLTARFRKRLAQALY